ncbi:MAG: amidohydrolase family protein [Acidimicrobiia bacterium]|nr:amidohydrolase family protein [Acidimicrobiia bacterium]
MTDLVIRGGTVVVPGEDPRPADIVVDGGRIVGLDDAGSATDARRTIDATGLHVLPGAVDPHVHLGNYQPLEVDVEPGTALAALGGVTTIVNYFKDPDSYLERVPEYLETYRAGAHVDAAFHLQLLTETHLDELEATTREHGITSYKINLAWKGRATEVFGTDRPIDNGWVRTVMGVMRSIDPEAMVLNVHCENQELKDEARRRLETEMEPTLEFYERLAPPVSEADAVQSMLLLARESGVRTYLVHLSAAMTMELLDVHPWVGDRVTAETCNHYLAYTSEEAPGLDATVSPPIRSGSDREALWEAVADGRIATVGSDSNPQLRAAKMGSGDFWDIVPGFDGVGTMLPVVLSEGHHRRGLPLGRVAEVTAANAARAFGLYPRKGTIAEGSDADLVLVDLDREHTPSNEDLTGPHNDVSIYAGYTFRGWPVTTLSRGEVVAHEGRVVSTPGRGRYLPRDI